MKIKKAVAILLLVAFVASCHRGGCPSGEHYEWVYDDTGSPKYHRCVDD